MPVFDKLSSVFLNRRNLTRQRLLTTTALYKNSRSLLNPVNRLCVKLAWDWFQSRQKWYRAHTERNGSKMAVILKSMRGGMYRLQELGVTQHLSLVNETDFLTFSLEMVVQARCFSVRGVGFFSDSRWYYSKHGFSSVAVSFPCPF